jgi:thioredoxin-related protein
MRFFSIFLAGLLLVNSYGWETDFDTARQKAREENKLILLNFSGSDWCGPCIRMKKEIFDDPGFIKFAESGLVLVNADFPRLRKNRLPAVQEKKNDGLAEKYNPQGHFPFTLLLDAAGNVLHKWDGYPNKSAEEFTLELQTHINARR